MKGASVMKKIITLNNKFTESEVKKKSKFSRSRNFDFPYIHISILHFNIYDCLKWLEKPLWLINTKFGDIADILNKYRSRSPKMVCKKVVCSWQFNKIHKKASMLETVIKKVADY